MARAIDSNVNYHMPLHAVGPNSIKLTKRASSVGFNSAPRLQHGRVKVKTTAQQEAERQLQRQKKIALYTAAMGRIFEKREASEFDEEILRVTAQVLENNPDDATLWNVRRETFLHMKEKGDVLEDRTKDELTLVQQALLKNPKSYGAWWHRGWVNENLTASPDWSRELQLTGLFLEKDDRNFHCWDYRRFVLERCPVPLEDELKFTRERIDANFSNYSSWHYRSHLLPRLFPGDREGSIREDILLDELDLVLNAAFTDPQDQSAWMYHRWLLGKVEPSRNLTYIHWYRTEGILLVTFGQEVPTCDVVVKADSNIVAAKWRMVGGPQSAYVWTYEHESLQNASEVSVGETTLSRDKREWRCESKAQSGLLTAARSTVLQGQLENARQLVEMEPDSKWPLLTTALLMNALQDPEHRNETLALLDTLSKVDSCRRNYYKDLKSQMTIEGHLEPNAEVVDLADKSLTCLRHCHLMSATVSLNLAGNQLSDAFLYQLKHCARLTSLVLDGNPIKALDFLVVLPRLQRLSLRHCEYLHDVSGLRHCAELKEIVLSSRVEPHIMSRIRELAPTVSTRTT
ncbi:geranylgeranyl transferase type-2 subunit alpha-like [Tropilaelaps mercedesae]|uniref:Geranylgeranyl transferase type-2 subunit alpha n=1 Tax=Tropilaelaps mercedesae TaxID=418985 RepID=A0A1V9XYU3_9ACAR|nr:geranylgeranyl transferase type-2 subunit alpha-like [Tropilaelaps mercedesae]